MLKKCEICEKEFETVKNGHTRKYCYECSPSYPKGSSHSKTISALRRAMKQEAIKRKGGKCEECGYDRCQDALVFHHENPEEKEFGLAQNGITRTWKEYWNEAQKCKLLCANCHAEKHWKLNNENNGG